MKIRTIATKEIDLDKLKREVFERKRSNGQHLYNKKERVFLTKLYVMFGRGEFKECVSFCGRTTREMRELVDCSIFEILWDFNSGLKVELDK